MFSAMFRRTRTQNPRANNDRRRSSYRDSWTKKRKFHGEKIDVGRFISKTQRPIKRDVVVSKLSFIDLSVKEKLKKAILSRGFITPTPIQEKAIPAILAGRDLVGLAGTGTGKTAAFLIPMLNKILLNRQEKVLIVVPTRELAIQIREEFILLAQKLDIFSVAVIGGANIQRQIRELRFRHNVIIGTPGRLRDLISRKFIDLASFGNVVLDEADRMLDMGFLNDIKQLLSLMSKKRQTLFFSATFSDEIQRLTKNFLDNPEMVLIKSEDVLSRINQDVVKVPTGADKIEMLHDLLIKIKFEKVLVFSCTKYGADKLSKKLFQRGFKTDSIHGGKTQGKRQRALRMFKENIIDILVATDVAARGLDIPNVSHVINFDVPATYDDYVHRIGRTGRANKTGAAVTFVS
jgi:superfamily II DNA/RNA helicase